MENTEKNQEMNPIAEDITPPWEDQPIQGKMDRVRDLARGQMQLQQHFRDLRQQAEEFKALVPDFDLDQAMADPVFAHLVAPGGVGVEAAWFALHQQELTTLAMEAAVQVTTRKLTDAFRSGSLRPRETGADGPAAPVAPTDYRTATKEQREALKKRIREAAARGEKLYPGM